MPNHIIHVGADHWQRIAVLRRAGFEARSCKDHRELAPLLTGTDRAAAVLMSESHEVDITSATLIVRASVWCPIIVFRNGNTTLQEREFDLVVPPLTPPDEWITNLRATIRAYRETRAASEKLRTQVGAERQALSAADA